MSGSAISVKRVAGSMTLALMCVFCLGLSSPTAYGMDLNDAINVAGKQRMLSQRITKAYCLLGLGENVRKAQKQLDSGLKEYADNLARLRADSDARNFPGELSDIDSAWSRFKKLAETAPNKKNGRELVEQSDVLLRYSHALVVKLQRMQGQAVGELINVSGRQRMLSQRIAKLYFAYSWGIADDKMLDEMHVSVAEFRNALDFLMEAEDNTRKIKHALLKVKGQFNFAEKSFDEAANGKYMVYVMESSTQAMLRQMDNITHMYAEL